jgi:hypothetical protein
VEARHTTGNAYVDEMMIQNDYWKRAIKIMETQNKVFCSPPLVCPERAKPLTGKNPDLVVGGKLWVRGFHSSLV